MADITITAANIVPSPAATFLNPPRIAGAAITAGQIVYKDTGNLIQLSDSNAASPANTTIGIAVDSAAAGQPVAVLIADPALAGVTSTQGEILVLSANAGRIAPSTDLASGDTVIILGVGIGSNTVNFSPKSYGTALP